MTYAFKLEWNELSEDLREQKVDEYLSATWRDYRTTYALDYILQDIAEPTDKQREEAEAQVTEEDILGELHIREEAEYEIGTHFPIYF